MQEGGKRKEKKSQIFLREGQAGELLLPLAPERRGREGEFITFTHLFSQGKVKKGKSGGSVSLKLRFHDRHRKEKKEEKKKRRGGRE